MPQEPAQVLPDWLNSPAREIILFAKQLCKLIKFSEVLKMLETEGIVNYQRKWSLFNQIDQQLPSQVINNVL